MNYRGIVLIALGQAVCTAVYVGIAAFALWGLGGFLENYREESISLQIFSINTILLMLVVAAGISGSFVFDYSVLLAIQQRFKEAVLISMLTIGCLTIIGPLGSVSVLISLGGPSFE